MTGILWLSAIRRRLEKATLGPWFYRTGNHVSSPKTADSGGIHTRSPIKQTLPDGRTFMNDAVLFPVGMVTGDPYWIQKLKPHIMDKPAVLSMALEIFGTADDMEFICRAREDIPRLCEALDKLVALAKISASVACAVPGGCSPGRPCLPCQSRALLKELELQASSGTEISEVFSSEDSMRVGWPSDFPCTCGDAVAIVACPVVVKGAQAWLRGCKEEKEIHFHLMCGLCRAERIVGININAEMKGKKLSGTFIAKYPSGKMLTLSGQFHIVTIEEKLGETPVVETEDGEVHLLDPRGIVMLDSEIVWRPREHRLSDDMTKWLREHPDWDRDPK